MFNLKTAIKGAAAGFIISFIAGIIGRVDFLIILLRAFLSALFSGGLFGGVGVLYNLFLGGGADGEFAPNVSKPSPAGSVVDIILTDDDLPDSDVAPDFAISPGTRVFDTPPAASRDEPSSERTLAEKSEKTADFGLPGANQTDTDGTGVFEPIALGGASVSRASEKVAAAPAAAAAHSVSTDAEQNKNSLSSDNKAEFHTSGIESSVSDTQLDGDVENAGGGAEADPEGQEDSLIDDLPDMDAFSPGEEYYEEDDNDTFSAVSPRSSASRASGGDSPVDISDAKNIADAIRTALKKES